MHVLSLVTDDVTDDLVGDASNRHAEFASQLAAMVFPAFLGQVREQILATCGTGFLEVLKEIKFDQA